MSLIVAPIFGPSANVILALTLLGFDHPLSAEEIGELGGKLRDVGLVVTKRSRGRPPSESTADAG